MNDKELEKVRQMLSQDQTLKQLPLVKQHHAFDQLLENIPFASDINYLETTIEDMSGEWVGFSAGRKERIILYLHGGYYMFGSAKTHRVITGELARAAQAHTLAINYRLAPAHLFPSPIEDAFKAYQWLLKQGFAPHSIALAGDSAGGGLTLALLTAIRDAEIPLPSCAVVFSPWTDLTVSGSSVIAKADQDKLLTSDNLLTAADIYLGGTSSRDPLASPLYANLQGLPPLLIQVGESEILLDDAARLAASAAAAGVKVRFDCWPAMFHVWQLFAPFLTEGKHALEEAGKFINCHIRP